MNTTKDTQKNFDYWVNTSSSEVQADWSLPDGTLLVCCPCIFIDKPY